MLQRLCSTSPYPRFLGTVPRYPQNSTWIAQYVRRFDHGNAPSPIIHRRFLHDSMRRSTFPMISSLNLASVMRSDRNCFYFVVSKTICDTKSCMKFSSTPASASATTVRSEEASKSEKSSKGSDNIFLDNIGTIFLIFIASLIAWMVRGYYNGVRRNTVREKQIESMSHADPIELDDLRAANAPEFTLETFQYIRDFIIQQKRDNDMTFDVSHDTVHGPTHHFASDNSTASAILLSYPEFVQLVRTAMIQMKGEAFTIQLGHVMDRVVVAALEKERTRRQRDAASETASDGLADNEESSNILDATSMPLEFWLTALTLAMSGTPFERIQAIHSIFRSSPYNNSGIETPPAISIDQVVQLVGYLQDTCQLVSDAQVIMTTHKYPLQEYVVASPEQLVDRQQWDDGSSNGSKGANNITVDMLTEILSSRSVCAWGECYRYKSK